MGETSNRTAREDNTPIIELNNQEEELKKNVVSNWKNDQKIVQDKHRKSGVSELNSKESELRQNVVSN